MHWIASLLDWAGRIITAVAVLAAGLTGYQTYLAGQPAWVVGLAAAAMFALVSWGLVVWRGKPYLGKQSFDQLRARERDKRLAKLRGREEADRKFKAEQALASSLLGGGIANILKEEEDLRRARHQARVKRIEAGFEE